MYKHKEIEQKWQKIWEKTKAFKTTENFDKKFYVLDMFPYPSGSGLHVGHPEGYTATDIVARYKRLNNFDVLHPIGWDAFGLPAEQYALNTGNHPDVFTQQNIIIFKKQLKSLGFSFDYSKEIDTTDPRYYKWTQWIFKKLYQQGLAKIQEIDVNWCPQLGTVLSNEEVLTDINGNKVSERGGFLVFKKPMKQWVLKITAYADKLLEGLNEVDFPESLKTLQTTWIGKNVGMEVFWNLQNSSQKISTFTTRIDTIYGVQFLVIAPNHSLTESLIKNPNKTQFLDFLAKYNALSDREKIINKTKEGIFTGSFAIHPLTKELIPIWTANYVLKNFGTGVIMGVPTHDERDLEFAQKYALPIKTTLKTSQQLPYLGVAPHINSQLIENLDAAAAKSKLEQYFLANHLGQIKVTYKLRDWIFSRQRYWGEPFPILFDEKGQIHLVNDVLLLPKMEKIAPSGTGESPLANNKTWVNVEINGKKFFRETNTMPQWAGSSWYYLAYIMKQEDGSYLDLDSPEAYKKFQKWLPVDLYIGGQEHAVLHLLYARFWHKVLFDVGIVPTSEPFYKIVNQGMILGSDGQKMSKSKGNVINPDEIIEQLGADTLRVYEMFMGPLTDTKAWSVESINGVRKWLDRVWNLYENVFEQKIVIDPNHQDLDFELIWHLTIKDVTECIEDLKFNIAISKLMIFINALYKISKLVSLQPLVDFAIMFSTFAPHIAEELLEKMAMPPIQQQLWPTWDSQKIVKSTITIAIQINGKLRATIDKNLDEPKEVIIKRVLDIPNVQKYLENKNIKKTIYIHNKIINFII